MGSLALLFFDQFHVNSYDSLANWHLPMIAANPAKRPRFSPKIEKAPAKPQIEETVQTADGAELQITVWYARRWPLIHEIVLSGRHPVVTVQCIYPELQSRLAWVRAYATANPVQLASEGDEIDILTEIAARVIDTQMIQGHGARLYGGRTGGER